MPLGRSGSTMKRVLMVAYHFPPLAGSSGVQRTLRFVQNLPSFGWEPLVLTTHPRAYEQTSDDLLTDIPAGTVVSRAFALDAARHLAINGHYLGFTARPDRWISWKFAGIREGLRLIRRFRPQAIWSTYPIATAHVIGCALARRSGLPWVADFRDPMAQDGYPPDPQVWRSFKAIEEDVLARARLSLFTAPGAVREYRSRYPDAADRIGVLENGYDEDAFLRAEQQSSIGAPLNRGGLTLLHSGIVYPEERDPTALFAALGRLAASNALTDKPLRLRFRAAVHEDLLRRLAAQHHIAEFVELLPALPYEQALAEMLRADGLLVMQAANCNDQIPAKIYEYLRAKRPIVALTEPGGDTGRLVAAAGVDAIAPLNDVGAITDRLSAFLVEPGHGTLPRPGAVRGASRHDRARQLAGFLDSFAA